MKVGFASDWTGASTQKIQIVAETTDGKFVCRQSPMEMVSINGTKYQAETLTGLFLRDKKAIFDIHEE